MIEIINITATSAATSVTTPPVDLGDLTNYSVDITFTGSNVVGTLTLESSVFGTQWNTVSGSSQAVTASTNHEYTVCGASYRYFRLKWVYTSGTGNISARTFIKEMNVKVKGS